MGLSSFPPGVVPLLLMNTAMSVSFLKNMLRSLLQAVASGPSNDKESGGGRGRRVSVTRYRCLRSPAGCGGGPVECCVCLSGFEREEEVSQLSCNHFFHKGCLDTWFDNHHHATCPLCRSIW